MTEIPGYAPISVEEEEERIIASNVMEQKEKKPRKARELKNTIAKSKHEEPRTTPFFVALMPNNKWREVSESELNTMGADAIKDPSLILGRVIPMTPVITFAKVDEGIGA